MKKKVMGQRGLDQLHYEIQMEGDECYYCTLNQWMLHSRHVKTQEDSGHDLMNGV